MPYGWLAFLNGNVTVKDQTVGLDINPIQVVEHLERPFWFSYAEARKGRVTLYNDLFYANLGATDGITFRRVAPHVGGH